MAPPDMASAALHPTLHIARAFDEALDAATFCTAKVSDYDRGALMMLFVTAEMAGVSDERTRRLAELRISSATGSSSLSASRTKSARPSSGCLRTKSKRPRMNWKWLSSALRAWIAMRFARLRRRWAERLNRRGKSSRKAD